MTSLRHFRLNRFETGSTGMGESALYRAPTGREKGEGEGVKAQNLPLSLTYPLLPIPNSLSHLQLSFFHLKNTINPP